MEKSVLSKQKTAKLDGSCYRYGIDQLEIASKEECKQLNAEIIKLRPFKKYLVLRVDVLDLRKLKNRKNKDVERKKYKELYRDGFKSIIRMTCPTPSFFNFLSEYYYIFGVYRIWIIEIYKDILLDSEQDAIILTDRIIDSSFKRYSTETFLYDDNDPYTWNKDGVPLRLSEEKFEVWQKEKRIGKKYDRKIIGTRTLYLGEDEFCFVVYARYAKRDNKPCIHLEWRILWSGDYKKFPELGVIKKNCTYLESLKNLTEFHIAEIWDKLSTKYIRVAEINKEKVGKQLSDCQGSPKSFDNMKNEWRQRRHPTADEKRDLKFEFLQLEKIYGIKNTSEFVRWWDENREQGKDTGEKSKTLHYTKFLKHVDFM